MNADATAAVRPLSSILLHGVVLVSIAVAGAASAELDGPQSADGSRRIYVADIEGDVEAIMRGAKHELRVDSTIELPARITTGSDGRISIRQSRTVVSLAGNAEIEIPESAAQGQLIARIVQHRGNAFYDVERREVGKLRVETPFLVAVVKGTQFDVAVQSASTTISLFEGVLGLEGSEGTELVELHAGEIAVRAAAGAAIRVLGMNANRAGADASGPDARVVPELAGPPARIVAGAGPSAADRNEPRTPAGSDGASGSDVTPGPAGVSRGRGSNVPLRDVPSSAGTGVGSPAVELAPPRATRAGAVGVTPPGLADRPARAEPVPVVQTPAAVEIVPRGLSGGVNARTGGVDVAPPGLAEGAGLHVSSPGAAQRPATAVAPRGTGPAAGVDRVERGAPHGAQSAVGAVSADAARAAGLHLGTTRGRDLDAGASPSPGNDAARRGTEF